MKRISILIAAVLVNLAIAFACFWDYDTIEMERQQFPSVIELISGKFLRHSPEFHYWRIKDREKKLKKNPDSLNLYDDLAVSWSKIGDDKKAIEIILQKEKLEPGLYETYANLGTFYLHNRQLKKGIEYIDKAIEINPNAHFGREIYQKYLAEYVLGRLKNGKLQLPLDTVIERYPGIGGWSGGANNFYSFLLDKKNKKANNQKINHLTKEEIEKAIIGVMGMMKFGNYDSPVLLEILGDLLLNTGKKEGARQLAVRAYLKASYSTKNKKIALRYYLKASGIAEFIMIKGKEIKVESIEKQLKAELKEGQAFFDSIKRNEIQWINSGKNPEMEFANKYYKEPSLKVLNPKRTKRKTISRAKAFDTTLTNIIDYRPVLKHKILLNDSEMLHIDSMYERSLVKEVKLTVKPVKNEVEDSFNWWYIYGFAGLLIISIVGVVIKMKKPKNIKKT